MGDAAARPRKEDLLRTLLRLAISATTDQKKITIVKYALFIATQNGELGDECKDIWHVQTQDENGGDSSGRVTRAMNCVTM